MFMFALLPDEILVRVISFLCWPACNFCTSGKTSPFHVYPLLLTSKHLYHVAFPFIVRRICTAAAVNAKDGGRLMHNLILQLQRPEIRELVHSICLHLHTCHEALQYTDKIVIPELKLRSICITRHLLIHGPRRYRPFNFAGLVKDYTGTLQELNVHIRWHKELSAVDCDCQCKGQFCQSPLPDASFACAKFEQLQYLSIDGNLVFQYASRPWDFKSLSYERFWLPKSLKIFDLQYERLFEHSQRTLTTYLAIDSDLEDESHLLRKNILSPCYQSGNLGLETLYLTINTDVPDLWFNKKSCMFDSALDPRKWFRDLESET